MFYFLPKTRIGKVSFWLVIGALIIIYLNYWLSMMTQGNSSVQVVEQGGILIFKIILSLLAMGCMIIAGITSFVSIIKYRDYAISLFISSLIGLMGIVFVLGEFLVPH